MNFPRFLKRNLLLVFALLVMLSGVSYAAITGTAYYNDSGAVLDGEGNEVGISYNHLDTTYSPTALWKMDGNLLDISGNNFDLVLDSGTERYTELLPGVKGLRFDGSTKYKVLNQLALEITGDLTIEALVNVHHIGNNNMTIIDHSNNTENEVDNMLYRMDILGEGNTLISYSEYGAGNNNVHGIDDGLMPGVTYHLAMVRENNEVTYYLNGSQLGATSSGLSAPTGGTAGTLWVGDDSSSGGDYYGAMASLKVIADALTISEIRDEVKLTLGMSF